MVKGHWPPSCIESDMHARLLGEGANDFGRDVEEENGRDEGKRENQYNKWVTAIGFGKLV